MHPAVGYRELAPPRELRDLVACVWVRVSGADDEVRIVPDGCSDVIWQQGVGTKVVGPDTTAKLVGLAQGDVMIGMRFLPAAGGGGLRMPLDELRDQRVDAAEIDPAFDLPAELAPADVAARFVAAAADRQGDPLVAAAIARLGNQEGGGVGRGLWIRERQLRRRFHAAVGYGPKTLARILRFR